MNSRLFLLILILPALIWAGSKFDSKSKKILRKSFGDEAIVVASSKILSKNEKKEIESQSRIGINEINVNYYTVTENSKIIAIAIERERTTKSGYVVLLTIVDTNSTIQDVHLLKVGNSRSMGLHSKLFRRQFNGKSKNDALRYNVDIDGVSGATSSSTAAIKCVKLSLYLSDLLVQ